MKIAALTSMAIALLLAAPAQAQTPSQSAAPRAEANSPPKGARQQSSAVQSAVPRQSSKMQAAGSESGTGTAPLVANQVK